MIFIWIRLLLILAIMLSGMGESLHAITLFDFDHGVECEIATEHFDSPDHTGNSDCPLCHLHSVRDYIYNEDFSVFYSLTHHVRTLENQVFRYASRLEIWSGRAPPVVS
jgi:hypothetical protein